MHKKKLSLILFILLIFVTLNLGCFENNARNGQTKLISGYYIDPINSENVSMRGFQIADQKGYTGILSENTGDTVSVNFYGSHLAIRVVYNNKIGNMRISIYQNQTGNRVWLS